MASLWDFSIEFYQQAGVKARCLDLQDNAGVDVCMLLSVLWLGQQGHRLTAAQLQLLCAKVGDWQSQIVLPLRALRRRARLLTDELNNNGAKDYDSNSAEQATIFYQQLKQLELEGERLTLMRLNQLIDSQAWFVQAALNKHNRQQSKLIAEQNLGLYLEGFRPVDVDSAKQVLSRHL